MSHKYAVDSDDSDAFESIPGSPADPPSALRPPIDFADAPASPPESATTSSHIITSPSTSSFASSASSSASTPKYDRFGFVRDGGLDAPGTPETPEARKRHRKAASREIKWRRMLEDWQGFRQKKPGKIKSRLRKGIPDKFRSRVWQILVRSQLIDDTTLNDRDRGQEFADAFAEKEREFKALAALPSEAVDQIRADITRTFPQHVLFREHGGSEALFNVLKAYSVFDPVVGYCQGMGFIVATLLVFMGECESFWMFTEMMQAAGNYRLTGLFRPGMPLVPLYLYMLDRLIEEHLPSIHAALKEKKIENSLWASPWIITLFSSAFPFELVVRVWDILLNEGVRVIFQVCLALLKIVEHDVTSQPFEQAAMALLALPQKRELLDPDRVLKAAVKYKITYGHLQQLEVAYHDKMLEDAEKKRANGGVSPTPADNGDEQEKLRKLEEIRAEVERLRKKREEAERAKMEANAVKPFSLDEEEEIEDIQDSGAGVF